jgi:hypothetical protein
MKKLIFLSLLIFLIKSAAAQTTSTIKGRVIGQDMEELEGVIVINICNAETVTSNKRGFFHINTAKGDTLMFTYTKYSSGRRGIKHVGDNVNVILIDRKAAALPNDFSIGELRKAVREDDKSYEILEKGAKRNGLWNY